MRLCVVGAGAIGAYVGACLARGGTEVTLVARGEHLRAMREHGVRVLSEVGDFSVQVEATDDFDAIAASDCVFVALKANSLPELAPVIGRRLAPGAVTVWAQNGVPWWYFDGDKGPLASTRLESVDPGGVVSEAIPGASVVGCVVYCSTEIVSPGVVRHLEGERFSIGEPDGSVSDRCRAIEAAFTAGGLRAPIDARLREQIWLKLVGNVAFNPVTALTGSTLGQLGDSEEMMALLKALFEESAAVAAALGITFRIPLERRLRAGIAVGDHHTSMLQDVRAHKPLEIDCMSGAVIELAERLGIAVPHLEAVHACVKHLDHVVQSAPR